MDEKNYNINIGKGGGIGVALAVVISYTTWKSISWAILHGILHTHQTELPLVIILFRTQAPDQKKASILRAAFSADQLCCHVQLQQHPHLILHPVYHEHMTHKVKF